ncbi:MAG: WxL domain-containing protein, partial [Solirubrobacteraceae bacterium]|nr:WxL domain-containing protein [Solirubrobacteraceae bacterium]
TGGSAMYSVGWAGGSTAFAGDGTGKPYRYAAPQPPDGDVEISETLVPGSLSFIDSTPGNVTFPPSVLTNANQVVSAAQPITVADATGSGDGWAVTVTSTTFTTGSKTLVNNSTSVPTAPSVACKASTTCTLATNTVSYPFGLPAGPTAPTAEKLYNATAGTGLGAQTFTPTWQLKIPATTVAGTYTSTWTYTLTSGP